MSHQVENMFSVKHVPWHGLGKIIADAPSVKKGIIDAGLDWTTEETELLRQDVIQERLDNYQNYVMPDGKIDYKKLFNRATVDEDAKCWYRSTDRSTLGVVGHKSFPLQNELAFEFFQSFIDNNEAQLETAGSLAGGRKIWVLAQLNKDPLVIKGQDAVRQYLMLSNSHDGTQAVRVGYTPIRIVCANTLAMAHKAKDSQLIRLRHSQDVEINLESVKNIIDAASRSFKATAEQMRALANKNINQEDLKKYVKEVFAFKDEDDDMSTRSFNILTAVMDNFEAGKGHELAGTTWWGAYNAVSEYLNYSRGHNPESRLQSLWFGQNFKTNHDALKLAVELAA